MTSPISTDESIQLSLAVDAALFDLIGESLPYMKTCTPVTSIEELDRRFRTLEWATQLMTATARAGVHNSAYGMPYKQYLTDALNFLKAADAMSEWLKPKGA